MKIVVLAGGLSNERNVSLASGIMVSKALRKKHQVAFVDMFLGVNDHVSFDDLTKEKLEDNLIKFSESVPDFSEIVDIRKYNSNSIIGSNVIRICKEADLVFLALHGGSGEDGRIQATLDILGIPYTGSDYLSSALAMNKDLTKELVQNVGVNTPDWDRVFIKNEKYIDELIDKIDIPVVIKVPDSGSSVGVFIVKDKDKLIEALNFNVGKNVIIEQYIEGREIQMAFLGDKTLPSIEIISNSEFYNYSSKYQKGIAKEVTPADITDEQEIEMGNMLMKVVKALNLYTYSRADFIIDKNGKIWFIEINSLPGMTSTSLVPQEAKAAGINFDDLCEIIVKDGIKRKVGIDKYIN